MLTPEFSRQWIREVAALRQGLVQLKRRVSRPDVDPLELVHRAIQLADSARAVAVSFHDRCAALEHHVQRSTGRITALLDRLPVAIITTDASGAILHANQVAVALIRPGAPTLQHQPLLRYVEDRPAFEDILRQLPEASSSITSTIRLRPAERAPVTVDVTVLPDAAEEGWWLWFVQPRSSWMA